MIFSTKEDIEAPIDQVFRMVSDFEALEKQALRRGAEVRRTDKLASKGIGMCWQAGFRFRGKQRDVSIELTEFDVPNRLAAASVSGGLQANLVLDLVALSRRRTRMSLDMELTPTTLSSRLLVQSLKLARGKLNRRFHLRVAEYAKDLEDRFNRRA